MIASVLIPLALLPVQEGGDEDLLKTVLGLVLFALFAFGKVISKAFGGPKARTQDRRPPARPVPRRTPRTSEPEEVVVDSEAFWDELVAQATAESPRPRRTSASAMPSEAVLDDTASSDPLGVDLDALDGSLPSHSEEFYESQPDADLAIAREAVAASILPSLTGEEEVARASLGHRLRESIDGRDGWRRALVLSEVLAPPLALRSEWGPPGSR